MLIYDRLKLHCEFAGLKRMIYAKPLGLSRDSIHVSLDLDLKRKTQKPWQEQKGLDSDCLRGNSSHWLSHSMVIAHQNEIRRDKPLFTCFWNWGIQDKSSMQTVGLPAEIPAPTFTIAGQVAFLAFVLGTLDLLWNWGNSCQHLARVNILSASKKHVSRVLVFRITKLWASYSGPDLVSQHMGGEVRRIRHFRPFLAA